MRRRSTACSRRNSATGWTRSIQTNIKQPLAEELLFGKLAKGGTVLVTVKDGKLVLTYPDAPGGTPGRRKREPALAD